MAARWPAEAHRGPARASAAAERQGLLDLLTQLTGPASAGRLAGSPGARVAAALIARHWAALGLEPPRATGYLRPVQVPASRLLAPPSLAAGGAAFTHRSDFAEDVTAGAAGQADGPLRVLVPGRGLALERLAGSVLLIARPEPDLDLAATAAQAGAHGVRGMLVATAQARTLAKSVHPGGGVLPIARLAAGAAASLAAQDGVSIRLDLPISRSAWPCHNVVATLPGADRSRALLISAHFDHVGDDPGGARFPGALDNASGVALMLQLAQRLARRPRAQRPTDIVFAALTGEESGLHGARALLDDLPRRWAAAINLDAIGLRQPRFAIRLGHARRGDPLADRAADWLGARGLEIDAADGRDDSAAWRRAGIPTLGLGQQRRGGTWPMHTPQDTLQGLDLGLLQALTDLVDDLITQLPAWLPAPQLQGALP